MLYSAFILGLVSSLHCLGMCGPIALALPVPKGGIGVKVLGRLLYNAGRICTYALLGLVIGYFGQNLVLLFSQQYLSVMVGLVLLAFVILPAPFVQKVNLFSPAVRLTSRVKSRFAQLLRRKSLPALFLVGVLNGLLPCGMVYAALAGALASASSGAGMGYMALFGLGTIPVMLSASLGGQWLGQTWRITLRKAVPVFTISLALLLVLRGLNLGIPLVSPALTSTPDASVKPDCCHKH